jgi:hypothetical protein
MSKAQRFGGRMHRTALVLIFVAGALVASGDPVSLASHVAGERVRLRAHFDSVLFEIGASDVAHLTADQRAARTELSTWLAEYRDEGRFPLNDRYTDGLTPIFRDARGVTCAMAYLIERSGRRDIVDRIERTKNLAYIRELASDPELVAWLDSAGLSVAEASRIQPTYPPNPDEIVDKSYAKMAVFFNSAAIATATWNLARPGNRVGFLGVFVGALTVLQSLSPDQLGNAQRRDKSIDAMSRVTGASAVIAGLWAINRKPPSTDRTHRLSGVEMAPIVGVPFGSQLFTVGLAARF